MSSNLILSKLAGLRRKLSLWIFVHGLGRWLLIGLAILGFDMVLDRLFKMDFAQRLVMLILIVAALVGIFIWRVLRPMLFRASDTALIYEVENHYPDLKEALISGFQLSSKDNASVGVSNQLVQATIESGNRRAGEVDFAAAIDAGRTGLNWAILVAGIGAIIALGVGVTSQPFLQTWFNRNVMLGDAQWPQQTYLEVAGVVDGKLTVPRGADHRQLVIVSDRSSKSDVSVSLVIDNPSGRSVVPMKPTGKEEGREHLFTFHNVSSEFRFRATGGDDTTDWITVVLVEPPNVIDLNMTAKFPAYTGQPAEQLVGGGPYSVLRGSQLEIGIEANKPLKSAKLKFGGNSVAMTQAGNESNFKLVVPESGQPLQGGEYEFQLEDQEGVPSNRKSKFKIAIKEDKPPRVRASLLGISGEVVPRAMVPTSYQATDEFGLEQLAFECAWKVGDGDAATPKSLQIPIARQGQEGLLKTPTNSVKTVSVLELSQLKLEPGISLKLRVSAKDFFPEQDNIGYSQEFLLRIVTEAQLRASLLRREIEQREAFQQAYDRQLALATELQAIRVRQKPEGMTDAAFRSDQQAKMIDLTRQQKSVGTAIDSVANRFEDFLVEVKNNRLDEAENKIAPDQRIETRFDQKIIQPIRRLDQELISLASRQIEACQMSVDDRPKLNEAADLADGIHQQILLEMKTILSAMSDSENFQGIINDILEIKSDTREINKGIDKQKPKDGDIFDDDDIFDK